MTPEDLLAELRDAGVLTVEDGKISLQQRYEDRYEEYEDRLEADGDVDAVLSDVTEQLTDVPTDTTQGIELLARYGALEDLAPNLDREMRLRVLIALFQIENPDLPTDGAPENFIPIDGSYLPVVIPLFRKAVVYIWLEECDPCDIMQDDLEDTFDDEYDDILPLAVYGPDCAETLHEEYDVVGGPVTLFIRDGSVDARLQGAHYQNVIESELESIRNLASASTAEGH